MLTDDDRVALAGIARHEQARVLLRGERGPLLALGFAPEVAAAAYLAYLAWIRARVPGHLLSGRPAYEAWDTLRSRALTAARRSGSVEEWGHDLFRRLRSSTSSLTAADAVWWSEARRQYASRWEHLRDDLRMTEVVTAARLLDEWLREIPKPTEVPDA